MWTECGRRHGLTRTADNQSESAKLCGVKTNKDQVTVTDESAKSPKILGLLAGDENAGARVVPVVEPDEAEAPVRAAHVRAGHADVAVRARPAGSPPRRRAAKRHCLAEKLP